MTDGIRPEIALFISIGSIVATLFWFALLAWMIADAARNARADRRREHRQRVQRIKERARRRFERQIVRRAWVLAKTIDQRIVVRQAQEAGVN